MPIDKTDLSTAAVDLMAARQEVAINPKLVKTADQMDRQRLDLLG